MIVSFKKTKTQTEKVFNRDHVKGLPPDIQERALFKLLAIHYAMRIEDLKIPAGNQLEQLKGNRKGQYSIRINKQWRVCFRFKNGDAYDVEIVDYH